MITDQELQTRGLPKVAFIDNSHDKSPGVAPIIAVKRGEMGYYPIWTHCTVDELNESNGVTKAQCQAMHIGSMVGWHVPGSYPDVFARQA
jgi:hypothetical protein